MRVLHIGLDYFVEPISVWAPGGAARLSDDHYRPWRPDAVREFLASRFGLDPARPRPGRVLRDHEAPLACWREWIASGELTAPFDLVHLDAHSCLGADDAGWFRVLGKLAHRPRDKRVEASPPGLAPENYLLFAAAYGWLRSITLVAHPQWEPDLLPILRREGGGAGPEAPAGEGTPGTGGTGEGTSGPGGDAARDEIEIRAYDPHLLERSFEDPGMTALPEPVSRDPAIPFRAVSGDDYRDEAAFDRIVVTAPEKYTPPRADALVPVLGAYVTGG